MAFRVQLAFALLLLESCCTGATRVTPASEDELEVSANGKTLQHGTSSKVLDAHDSSSSRRGNESFSSSSRRGNMTPAHHAGPTTFMLPHEDQIYGGNKSVQNNTIRNAREPAPSPAPYHQVQNHQVLLDTSDEPHVDVIDVVSSRVEGNNVEHLGPILPRNDSHGSKTLWQTAKALIETRVGSTVTDSTSRSESWIRTFLTKKTTLLGITMQESSWLVIVIVALLSGFCCFYHRDRKAAEKHQRKMEYLEAAKKSRKKYFVDGRVVYEWDQTASTISMYVKPPGNISTRKIEVLVWPESIYIGRKGKPPFIEEDLYDEIDPKNSSWFITEEGELQIRLRKVNEDQEWPCIISAHNDGAHGVSGNSEVKNSKTTKTDPSESHSLR